MMTVITSDGSRLPSRPNANRADSANVSRSRSPMAPIPSEITKTISDISSEMPMACQKLKYSPTV